MESIDIFFSLSEVLQTRTWCVSCFRGHRLTRCRKEALASSGGKPYLETSLRAHCQDTFAHQAWRVHAGFWAASKHIPLRAKSVACFSGWMCLLASCQGVALKAPWQFRTNVDVGTLQLQPWSPKKLPVQDSVLGVSVCLGYLGTRAVWTKGGLQRETSHEG